MTTTTSITWRVGRDVLALLAVVGFVALVGTLAGLAG